MKIDAYGILYIRTTAEETQREDFENPRTPHASLTLEKQMCVWILARPSLLG